MRNTKYLEQILSKEFEEIDFRTLRSCKMSDIAEKKLNKLLKVLSDEQITILNEYIKAHAFYEIEYTHEYGEFIIDFYKSLLK